MTCTPNSHLMTTTVMLKVTVIRARGELVEITKESIVRTTGGLVQGWREDGFEHWQGIPYAVPPVGPGRCRHRRR